jgi:putative hemolysin
MKIITIAAAVLLTGCATQTGVIPTGQDTYMVLRQGTGFWASPSTLSAEATREAADYCAKKGQVLTIISTREQPVGMRPGAYPEGEVRFSCKEKA